VDEATFNENIVWFVGIESPKKGGAVYVEKYYGMSDGRVVQIGRLAYSPDSWCKEYSYEEGLSRLTESIRASGYKLYHIAGNVPKIILEKLTRKYVIEEQLPR
jgi:hypothetical protein